MPPRKNVSADKNRRPSGPRPEKSRPENSRPGKPRPEHRRASRPDRTVGRLDSVAESRGSRIPAARPVDEDESADASGMMRLQKFLAMAGVDSRRNCEEYIRTGRVTVDSEVVIDPARSVNPLTQDIRVDSERLRKPRFRYFLVNKPKGVLCTNSDPQGRPRAVDLVPVSDQRLFTVGRLDENTEGMLLLTNDGDLAQKLAHPRFEVIRRYRCHVAGIPQPETLNQLRDGMYFAEGYFKFRSVHIYKRRGQSVVLEMELQEGKNREIRRLMARVGHKVLALERVAFGPLSLGSLAPGQHRELQPFEIHELHHFAEHGAKPVARGPRANDGFGYRSGQTRGASRKRPPVIKDRGPQRESSEIERNERPVAERSLRPSSEGSPRARAPQREARPPQRDTDRPMRSERPTGESRGRDRMPPRDRSPADGEVRGRAAQREQRPPQREMGATARSERPSSESRGRDRMPPRDRSSADGEVRGRAAQREERPPQREMGGAVRSERPTGESRGRDRMPPRERSSVDRRERGPVDGEVRGRASQREQRPQPREVRSAVPREPNPADGFADVRKPGPKRAAAKKRGPKKPFPSNKQKPLAPIDKGRDRRKGR